VWYLILTVTFASGTANVYVDDFRSKKYCEMAQNRWIRVHLQDLINRKAQNSHIKKISCVNVEEG
jgi:hypothetical protein